MTTPWHPATSTAVTCSSSSLASPLPPQSTGGNLGLALAAAGDTKPAVCLTPPITNEVIKCVSADGFQCPGLFRPEDVVDFAALPRSSNGPLRVRRPAHLVAADDEYVKKYEAGIRMMKDLDATDDPRSFKRQAAIHEAYCNFHYKVTAAAAAPEIDFDVHFSSILRRAVLGAW